MAAAPDNNGSEPPAGTPRDPLTRRWWLNLALLIVVTGLGLFAWYRAGHTPTDDKPPLTGLDPDAVQTVEIAQTGQPDVRLERRDGDWHLAAPIEARADTFAVTSLLRLLRAPVESDIKLGNDDLARYGLDPPKLTVRADANAIEFGERHPLKNQQYVKYGAGVYLIASQYYARAAAPYNNLIDSRLIAPGRKIVSIKLADFSLASKDGTWVREPPADALSSDRINAFVDEWQHARALQVEKHAGDAHALETVVVDVTKPDGGGAEVTVGVLAREPELVLYRADEHLEYHFPKDVGAHLLELKPDGGGPATESKTPDRKSQN